MEIYFAVTPLWVAMKCPKCKLGYMIANGKNLLSNPPSYGHTCSNPDCLFQTHVRGIQFPQFRNVVNNQPLDPQPKFEA